jgi:hypothetical protein
MPASLVTADVASIPAAAVEEAATTSAPFVCSISRTDGDLFSVSYYKDGHLRMILCHANSLGNVLMVLSGAQAGETEKAA